MLDIIIVEDNHEIGELLSDFLRNENYIVSVARMARLHWSFLNDTERSL